MSLNIYYNRHNEINLVVVAIPKRYGYISMKPDKMPDPNLLDPLHYPYCTTQMN